MSFDGSWLLRFGGYVLSILQRANTRGDLGSRQLKETTEVLEAMQHASIQGDRQGVEREIRRFTAVLVIPGLVSLVLQRVERSDVDNGSAE